MQTTDVLSVVVGCQEEGLAASKKVSGINFCTAVCAAASLSVY